jgi:DUF4097 and DUF4098 domain-containing protein YvlB
MNFLSRNLRYIAIMAIAAVIGISAANAFGQETRTQERNGSKYKDAGFCSSDNYSSERVAFRELREMAIPASGNVNLDAGRNGGIRVKGEERSDVLVRACVQAWGSSDAEAKARASEIRINTSSVIKADGPSDREQNWSVSYQLLVPRATNLQLEANNGGISISGVDGSADFETTNGGVSLSNVSGDVKGRTTNGGVHVELSGSTWRGGGLDLMTTNGGVHITMPLNYAAHFETATTNGGFSSDIPALKADRGDRSRGSHGVRINTDINGGGALIRVVTTNGGVHIGTGDSFRSL